jgi:hypothetical protein
VDFSGRLAIAAIVLIQLSLVRHWRAPAILCLVVEDKAEVGQARFFPVEIFNARRG